MVSADITLTREQQYVHGLLLLRAPVEVADYVETVADDPNLQHWTQEEKHECMTKLQNLGLIGIKVQGQRGAYRIDNPFDQSPTERAVQAAKGEF